MKIKLEKFSDLNNALSGFKHLDKAGIQAEAENSFSALFENDKLTFYKIGDRVVKATEEIGDVHKKGTKGIVVGARRLHKEPIEELKNIYLVKFYVDGKPEEHKCLTIDYKLGYDKE